MVRKDRTYCASYDCLIRTCSRHRCHLPKWYSIPIMWRDFHLEDCDMYVSKHNWKNMEHHGVEEDEDEELL